MNFDIEKTVENFKEFKKARIHLLKIIALVNISFYIILAIWAYYAGEMNGFNQLSEQSYLVSWILIFLALITSIIAIIGFHYTEKNFSLVTWKDVLIKLNSHLILFMVIL